MIKSQLDALQFVLRSDDRGLVPAFGCLHFYLRDGQPRVQTSSGIITFDAHWPGNPLEVTVPMTPVIKCMEAAPYEKARIVVNKRGDLMIKVADYSSKLVPFSDEFPRREAPQREGSGMYAISPALWNGELTRAIELLRPFISADATRPWSQYMLIRGGSLFATNNVALARYQIEELKSMPFDILLDIATVDHILRIRALGHEVSQVLISPLELLCEFDGDTSLSSWTAYRSLALDWPSVTAFEGVMGEGEDAVDPNLLTKLNTVASIAGVATDGVIFLYEHGALVQMEKTIARVWCGAFKRGGYMRSSLQQVLGVAERWSPSSYPSPVSFSGRGVQGVLSGVRGAPDSIDVLLQGDAEDA